jgi:small subunit ribosomal protein S9
MPTKKSAEEAEKKPKAVAHKPAAAKHAPAKEPAVHAAPKAHAAKVVAKDEAGEEAAVVAVEKAVNEFEGKGLESLKKLAGGSYIYALGRRKSAIAQARLFTNGKGEIKVNGKPYDKYFTVYEQQEAVMAPLKVVGQTDASVDLKVSGGGMRGQADAARLGISRALIELNPFYRKALKKLGYLMRDPREKERKKYGLKKARKAPQWAKR